MSYVKQSHFRIDSVKQYLGEMINIIQQDTYSNRFVITCLTNGYPIDLTELTQATVTFAKSDSFNVVSTADVLDAATGRISVDVDYQALTALGVCNVGVKLFFVGGGILTLTNFPINITLDPYAGTDGDIVSTSKYPILIELISEVEVLMALVQDYLNRKFIAIEKLDFYNNGYTAEYVDGSIKEWIYSVDDFGHIIALLNETDNKAVTINWNNTER